MENTPQVYNIAALLKNVRIYDNGGKTADRYTAVFMDRNYHHYESPLREALGFNDAPFHPQGVGQHVSAVVGKHLGRRIKFSSLNGDCKQFIKQNL